MRHPSPTRLGRGLGIGGMVRARRLKHTHRAAFTLVETLLVIALIVAVSAIALPIMASFAESSSFRSTCEQVSASGMYARAEAERSGRAVELCLEKRGGEWVLVAMPIGVATGEGSTLDGDQLISDDDASLSEPTPRAGEDVLMQLPRGWSVASRERVASGIDATDELQDEASEVDEATGDESSDAPFDAPLAQDQDWDLVVTGDAASSRSGDLGASSAQDESAPARVLLAIYWPGGTIVAGPREVRIGDGRGRRASVRANGWSGELQVAVLQPPAASGIRAEEDRSAEETMSSDEDVDAANRNAGEQRNAGPDPTQPEPRGASDTPRDDATKEIDAPDEAPRDEEPAPQTDDDTKENPRSPSRGGTR